MKPPFADDWPIHVPPQRRHARFAALICGLSWALAIHASNYFVRPNGSGSSTGADWNNAWSLNTIKWSTLSPGDTIYLAGGTYTNQCEIQAGNVTVRRVLASDPAATTAAGWDNSFDSTVLITNANTSATHAVLVQWGDSGIAPGVHFDNVTIDGRVAGGIRLGLCELADPNYPNLCVHFFRSASNITLTNIEFVGPGSPLLTASTGIYATKYYDDPGYSLSNLLVTHCTFHDMVQAVQTAAPVISSTIEHSTFYNMVPGDNGWTNASFNPQHDNTWWASQSTNIIFRGNIISNWATESLLLTGSGNGRWDIYDNIWEAGRSTARCYENQADNGPIYFVNNTCVRVPFYAVRAYVGLFIGGVSNNILFECGSVDPTNQDYNLFSGVTSEAHGVGGATTNIFVGYGSNDFHIVGTVGATYPAQRGVNLGSVYGIDFSGSARPATGNWDIGAYEVTTVAGPPPATGLRVVGK